VRPCDFALAVGSGRGNPYFAEGLRALWYGEQARGFLKNNAREVSLVFAAVVLVGGVGWIWYRKRQQAQA
jgi:hypothetical protein